MPLTKLKKRTPTSATKGEAKGAAKGKLDGGTAPARGKSPGAKTKPDGPPLSALKAKAKAALTKPSTTEKGEAALKVRGLTYDSQIEF